MLANCMDADVSNAAAGNYLCMTEHRNLAAWLCESSETYSYHLTRVRYA